MQLIKFLDLLNSTKHLYTLDCSTCDSSLIDYLEFVTIDEQIVSDINCGTIFINYTKHNHAFIVDGLRRIISLSLLLHAICECYKKTTSKNEQAIITIRNKFLITGEETKIRLPENLQKLYDKIIFGERLSDKEKLSPMFKLLHNCWTKIKEEKYQAGNIFKTLERLKVFLVNAANMPSRELFYSINKNNRELNQLSLISSYINDYSLNEHWDNIKKLYNDTESDIYLFFNKYFESKVNNHNRLPLYEVFVNYSETMLKYMNPVDFMIKLKNSAKHFHDILNVNFSNIEIKKQFINIKLNNGEDTYSYLLNIYEDYLTEVISESTFLEILSTINEYLINRKKTPNNVSFNELIQYLNALLTCK